MNKYTKKRIMDAFTDLVFEHGYDYVTAAMIMEKADVGKTTFYRYFRNKADIMNAHYKELYDSALRDENCKDLTDLFTGLFRVVREHPEELAMFDTLGLDSYLEFIYEYTYSKGKQIMETAWGRPLTLTEDFHVAFFCGGGARILQEWACGQYREMTPEQAGKETGAMVSHAYNVMIDKDKLIGPET